MKLLTFAEQAGAGEPRLGALINLDRIVDRAAAHARTGDSVPLAALMRSLIAHREALAPVRGAIAAVGPNASPSICRARDTVRVLPPIRNPRKFLCVAKNHRSQLEEFARNQLVREIHGEHTGFVKLDSVSVGDEAEVARYRGIETLDYEPELAFIIGERAFRARKEAASAHIAGITLTDDLTAREIQKCEVAAGIRFWIAKNMPSFARLGPS